MRFPLNSGGGSRRGRRCPARYAGTREQWNAETRGDGTQGGRTQDAGAQDAGTRGARTSRCRQPHSVETRHIRLIVASLIRVVLIECGNQDARPPVACATPTRWYQRTLDKSYTLTNLVSRFTYVHKVSSSSQARVCGRIVASCTNFYLIPMQERRERAGARRRACRRVLRQNTLQIGISLKETSFSASIVYNYSALCEV